MKSIHEFDNQKWGLLGAAWGDVFCSLESIKEYNIKNILYLGHMPETQIKDFLHAQDFIEQVETIYLNDKKYFSFWEDIISRKPYSHNLLKSILYENNIDIKIENIYNSCLDLTGYNNITFQAKNLKLPNYIITWAEKFVEQNNLNKFILVNPYSVNSSAKEDHWLCWEPYLDWLFSKKNYKFVFVGYNYDLKTNLNHENVLNLFNKLPSNLHVMGLSLFADSVITTSNSLSHWCNSHDILCTTMLNSRVSKKHDYFCRILNSKNIYKIWHQDSLEYGKLITNKINFNKTIKYRNFLIEDQVVDENQRYLYHLKNDYFLKFNFDSEYFLSSFPYVIVDDFQTNFFISMKILNRFLKIIKPLKYLEIGSGFGYGFLSLSLQNDYLTDISIFNENSELNRRAKINVNFLNERYGKKINLKTFDDYKMILLNLKDYDVIVINKSFLTFEYLCKEINLILKFCNDKLIFFNGFSDSDLSNMLKQNYKNKTKLISEKPNIYFLDLSKNQNFHQESFN